MMATDWNPSHVVSKVTIDCFFKSHLVIWWAYLASMFENKPGCSLFNSLSGDMLTLIQL